ncbi:MAG: hypothetical protein JRI91_08305 [Deltaproteobacteria bacterium]|nr:hypothetical protein [Deltaproteobacteria bacterium]
MLIFLVVSALYFHVLPFHKNGLKINREYWEELVQELCEKTDKNSLVLTQKGLGALKYYGNCFEGDVAVGRLEQIDKSFIEKKIKNKNYHSIFILCRNMNLKRSEWILNHQVNEIRKGKNGLIQVTLDPEL